MRHLKNFATTVCAAALLVACGGGGDGNQSPKVAITSIVSFGDSLSDSGTSNVGFVKALGGGKFTVNSPTAKTWNELLAAQYGLAPLCAAQTGLPHVSALGLGADTPIVDFVNCTNYAQGSGRISNPAGPHSEGLYQIVFGATYQGAIAQLAAANGITPEQAAGVPAIVEGATKAATEAGLAAADIRLIALPIKAQMAKVSSYSGKELVTVLAGANDVFMHLNGLSSAAAGGGGAVVAGIIAGWNTRADWATLQAKLAGGGPTAAAAAQQAAIEGMAAAGTELAQLIKAQVAKGAKQIVVVNVPDVGQTPFAATGAAVGLPALLTALTTTFNKTLTAGLGNAPEIVLVDAFTQGQDQYARPSAYGVTNVGTTVCSTVLAANNPLKGSSLTCSAANSIAGDTSFYAFADPVHPTPYAHKLLAQFVARSLVTAGWL